MIFSSDLDIAKSFSLYTSFDHIFELLLAGGESENGYDGWGFQKRREG